MTAQYEALTMMRKQHQINTIARGADWQDYRHSWHTAALREAVEFLDCSPWPWWKRAAADPINARTELVDLHHFHVAMYLNVYGVSAEQLNDPDYWNSFTRMYEHTLKDPDEMGYVFNLDNDNINAVMEELTFAYVHSLCDVRTHYVNWRHHVPSNTESLRLVQDAFHNSFVGLLRWYRLMMNAIGMTRDDLFKFYLVKNVLNVFRQRNGYNKNPQQNTYRKTWAIVDGRHVEDNELLLVALAEHQATYPEDGTDLEVVVLNIAERLYANAPA